MKPCPFCGSSKLVVVRAGNRSHINCDDCHASGPGVWGDNYIGNAWLHQPPRSAEAMAIWDKRADG